MGGSRTTGSQRAFGDKSRPHNNVNRMLNGKMSLTKSVIKRSNFAGFSFPVLTIGRID
jgi:hypothetical protein